MFMCIIFTKLQDDKRARYFPQLRLHHLKWVLWVVHGQLNNEFFAEEYVQLKKYSLDRYVHYSNTPTKDGIWT